MIEIKTSLGDIEITLFEDKAPITVANFLSYVNEGFFNETIFHRVIPDFVIQGGGFESNMVKKTKLKPSIQNEANNLLKNEKVIQEIPFCSCYKIPDFTFTAHIYNYLHFCMK